MASFPESENENISVALRQADAGSTACHAASSETFSLVSRPAVCALSVLTRLLDGSTMYWHGMTLLWYRTLNTIYQGSAYDGSGKTSTYINQ